MNTIINIILLIIFIILLFKNDCQNYFKDNQFYETLCHENKNNPEIVTKN